MCGRLRAADSAHVTPTPTPWTWVQEAFTRGSEQYAIETQLSKRVAEWQDKIEPRLAAEVHNPSHFPSPPSLPRHRPRGAVVGCREVGGVRERSSQVCTVCCAIGLTAASDPSRHGSVAACA